MFEEWRKYIHKLVKIFFSIQSLYMQFILIYYIRKSSWSDQFFRPSTIFFQKQSSSEHSAGPKISLLEKSVLVLDSRWRMDYWSIVARPPWTMAFAYVSREGGREGGQEGRAEKGCIDKDLSILSRAGPRRPGTCSMNGTRPQKWSTVPIGRARYHSGTRFDQSLVGFSSLVPSLSTCPFFLFLLSSPRTASYLDTAPPPLFLLLFLLLFLQFLPFLSFACPCLLKTL